MNAHRIIRPYKPTKAEQKRLGPLARRYTRVQRALGFKPADITQRAAWTNAALTLGDWPLFNRLMYGSSRGNPDVAR